MKRFDFPLERVRQWRHEQASLEELKLQKLYGDLASIDDLRQRTEHELRTAEQDIQVQNVRRIQDLANLDTFRQFIRRQLGNIAMRRQQCEVKVFEQRQVILEARRQFELLDRLRQKALADWRAARDKEEEELAAELYLAKRRRDSEM